jgi:hypothetical protein
MYDPKVSLQFSKLKESAKPASKQILTCRPVSCPVKVKRVWETTHPKILVYRFRNILSTLFLPSTFPSGIRSPNAPSMRRSTVGVWRTGCGGVPRSIWGTLGAGRIVPPRRRWGALVSSAGWWGDCVMTWGVGSVVRWGAEVFSGRRWSLRSRRDYNMMAASNFFVSSFSKQHEDEALDMCHCKSQGLILKQQLTQ